MKKLLLLFMIMVSTITFSQETSNSSKSFEEILKPYVEKSLDRLDKGIEYTYQEIPIVLQQYILYNSIISWSIVILGLLIFLCTFKIRNLVTIKSDNKPDSNSYKYHQYIQLKNKRWLLKDIDKDSSTTWEEFLYNLLPITTFIMGLIITLCTIGTAIKTTFFPKLFLIEKFIELF